MALLFIATFSVVSIYLSTQFLSAWAVSPLIVAILFGIILGNTIHKYIPTSWGSAFQFSAKHILRLGIILYGFQITLQEIFEIGLLGAGIAVFMVFSTFALSLFIGKKIGLEKETSVLVGAGSAVCGAAAVLATEDTIKAKPERTAVAVATVVTFGTIAMFLFPFLVHVLSPLLSGKEGIFLGGTIHEVAQVVAAGNMFSAQTAEAAVVVKMTRVLLLIPFLLFLGLFFVQERTGNLRSNIQKAIPWFALFFLGVILLNSFHSFSAAALKDIQMIDVFLLSMAMFSLGMQTRLSAFKNIGGKAFLLAGILFVWLFGGGLLFLYIFG